FLDQVVIQVARAVEIDHVKILRYRPETDDLLVAAGIGWKPGIVGTVTLSTGLRSAPGQAFQTAEPVVVQNFGEHEDYELSSMLTGHGIASLANAPIMVDGAAWGVLEVDSTTPRDFSDDTSAFLIAAGALIGSSAQHRGAAPSQTERLAAAMVESQYRQ